MTLVAVTGGKGGTGKTLIATTLTTLLAERGVRTLLVDVDVDNPCTKVVLSRLNLEHTKTEEVMRFKPKILLDKCDLCGKCVNVCPEHALVLIPGQRVLYLEHQCAGCSACAIVCDRNAIQEDRKLEGYIHYFKTANFDLVVGEIIPGEKRSYVMIASLLNKISNIISEYRMVIVDSPPGSGAGVYTIIRRVDKLILVTEPTQLGVHDLRKLLTLLEGRRREDMLLVVNKATLNMELTSTIEQEFGDKFQSVVKLPYRKEIVETYGRGMPITEVLRRDEELRRGFESIVSFVLS